jgi:uncharacterized repeat protein (TIGR01451 family)
MLNSFGFPRQHNALSNYLGGLFGILKPPVTNPLLMAKMLYPPMKKSVFALLFAILFHFNGHTQSCFPGGITFTSQAEVDNFFIDYPDCTTIEGDITIAFSTVSNLNGLQGIKVIQGGLNIYGNIWLSNLDGLQNLDSLGGFLALNSNQQLYNISGLNKLKAIGGGLSIVANESLQSLDGLQNITAIGEDFVLEWQGFITDFSPLSNITSIGGNVKLNYLSGLTNLDHFSNLHSVGGGFTFRNNYLLANLNSLHQLDSIGGDFVLYYCPAITDLTGLDNVNFIRGDLILEHCDNLQTLTGLNNLDSIGGSFRLLELPALTNLAALQNFHQLGQNFECRANSLLPNLQGLENLTAMSTDYELILTQNASLSDLSGLENLQSLGFLTVAENPLLSDLSELTGLTTLTGLNVVSNAQLISLNGLENLHYIGSFCHIIGNSQLTDISAFQNLVSLVGYFQLSNNPLLSDCAVAGICRYLIIAPTSLVIESNGPGCTGPAELVGQCETIPVVVRVLTDADGDCVLDPAAKPARATIVELSAPAQKELRPVDNDGQVTFSFIDQSVFTLSLSQFPIENWTVCQNNLSIDPANYAPGDTVRPVFLLKPVSQCPGLSVQLSLPIAFPSDCNATTQVSINTQNTGALAAQGVVTAVVLPPAFELLQSVPPVAGQTGDTLLFNLNTLLPFASATVVLTVSAKCSGFLPDQTFCWEAFSAADNACTITAPSSSEINVSAVCTGDSLQFTLKNIGAAATQNLHTYKIIRNKYIQQTETFSLAASGTLILKVPADGATWRVEATKLDDGTRTAKSLEGCGGLTPGLVTAFWLEKGPASVDYDCRQMVGTATDPFTMTAFPSGVGPTHLLPAGQPLQYTISFQNTGTDTVRQLRINDFLPPGFNPKTFKPVGASHAYQWAILSGNLLEVSFSSLALPDSNTNKEASRGFFTFSIDQMPGVAAGTSIYNVANLLFNNTPPSINTYDAGHIIGEPFPKGYACAPGGIQFYDQWSVDRFPIDYPGCVRVLGGVTMQYTYIENLDALNEVEYIGNLFLGDNYLLKDITGLQSLDSCTSIFLFNNAALKDLHGLENLKKVSSDFSISYSLALESLTGLNNLQSVGGNFLIYANIENLNALGNLTTVGGDFQPGSGPEMQDLHGLEKLTSIGGWLDLAGSVVSSLNGLNNLETVGSGVQLRDMYNLNNIYALGNLKTVGGSFSLINTALPVLDGLNSLTSAGAITVVNNPDLSDMNGFDNLKKVGTNLWINENPSLFLLDGLNALDSVTGDVEIQRNPVLYEMPGLQRLKSVGGNFHFGGNHLLVTVAGLDSLLHVGGGFAVSDNDNLNYFNGFHRLHAVDGSFYIYDNPKLVDLYGFEQLDTVGGSLLLAQNNLTNLNDLNNLRRVAGDFTIANHPHLVDVDSLVNLRTIGGYLRIESNKVLQGLQGFANLDSIGGKLSVTFNEKMTSLDGLQQLQRIPDGLYLENNAALLDLNGLNNVKTIGKDVRVIGNSTLEHLNGLNNLQTIGLDVTFQYNPQLKDFIGLENLDSIGEDLYIFNSAFESCQGLTSLKTIGGYLDVEYNSGLKSFAGLNNLTTVGQSIFVVFYNGLLTMEGLESLSNIGGDFTVMDCPYLTSMNGLSGLAAITGDLKIESNPSLTSLNGLENLSTADDLFIVSNASLTTLNGLDNLASLSGSLFLINNKLLTNIQGLSNLGTITGEILDIHGNTTLSSCAIFPVCNAIYNTPASTYIYDNAPDCNAITEVEAFCLSTPVLIGVLLDNNGDCQADASDSPVGEVQVQLAANSQMTLRPSDSGGIAFFKLLENGQFSLHLPQFPMANWSACAAEISLFADGTQDTLRANFRLQPLNQCPELTTNLELPAVFRGCLVSSTIQLTTQNSGAVAAEEVVTAIVVPPVFEVLNTVPPPTSQNGDTLFFGNNILAPFEKAIVQLTVKTKCDTFLFGQTLCWEAFSTLENACPSNQTTQSEIKLAAQCLGDTAVQFTLQNIGNAATIAPHQFRVFRNEGLLMTKPFSLDAQAVRTEILPADGATYRMEATKWNNGALTAVALENCAGLTPGQINAFWLEDGPAAYDFDCREVIGSFDPNQKTAVPSGSGASHLLSANQAIQYTIDFQNTGTDTAFRVQLRDLLDHNLDISTFKPGFASHPYTWEIRGNLLEVLFYPIALPDSNVNEPASHGFFSFEIDQKHDLSDGSAIENTANIIFDFNPPIVTNTVRHQIGQLTVDIDEPQVHANLWRVLGNPTREIATFEAVEQIAGAKSFDLFDATGRQVRSAQFSGQVFEFQRDMLQAGVYFFKIADEKGRIFSGKIVVVD